MRPTDFRNATFERLRADLNRRCESVYAAWQAHGPGTTRNVAGAAGIDILSFRPRTTDLIALGLLVVAGAVPGGHEGIYRLATPAEWEAWRLGQIEHQLRLI
jgi:hypothetical protein